MSEQKPDLKENQFEFEGSIVEVQCFEDKRFTYKGIKGEDISKISIDLYARLLAEIANFELSRTKIAEERRKAAEEKRLQEQKVIQDEFKVQLEKEVPDLMKLPYRFADLKSYSDPRYVWFSVDETSKSSAASLSWDGEVTKGKLYHTEKTDRVWVVEIDYKNRRYSNLANAAKAILEHVASVKKSQETKEAADDAYAEFANAVGLILATKSIPSGYNRNSQKYMTLHIACSKEKYYGEGSSYGSPVISLDLLLHPNGVGVTEATVTREKPFKVLGLGIESQKMTLQVALDTVEATKAFLAEVRKLLE